MRSNNALNRTAQQACSWVPSALRASAAGYRERCADCFTPASHRPGGAGQSAHRGGGLGTPRAGAARAAHPAAGAVGPVGEEAHLLARGSAAAPLEHGRMN